MKPLRNVGKCMVQDVGYRKVVEELGPSCAQVYVVQR